MWWRACAPSALHVCLSVASLYIQLQSVKRGRVSRPTGGSPYTRTDSGSLTPSVPPYGLYFVMVLYIVVGTCCAGVCHCFFCLFFSSSASSAGMIGQKGNKGR